MEKGLVPGSSVILFPLHTAEDTGCGGYQVPRRIERTRKQFNQIHVVMWRPSCQLFGSPFIICEHSHVIDWRRDSQDTSLGLLFVPTGSPKGPMGSHTF